MNVSLILFPTVLSLLSPQQLKLICLKLFYSCFSPPPPPPQSRVTPLLTQPTSSKYSLPDLSHSDEEVFNLLRSIKTKSKVRKRGKVRNGRDNGLVPDDTPAKQYLNSTPLTNVEFAIITSDLKLSTRITNTCNSAKWKLRLIYRNFHQANQRSLTHLYKTLVLPKLDYCIRSCVWDPHSAMLSAKLESVQGFAAKLCSKR